MTDLRAEVARAIDAARSEGLRGQADAAIAVVLEAAAEACTDLYDGGNAPGDWPTPEECAKAIRQMGSI